MGRKCGVANYKGNYHKQAKVKVYALPKNFYGSVLYLEKINIPQYYT